MNISFKWLKNYADIDLSAEQVATVLTDIGLEVEGFEKVETIRGGLEGVVVGQVLTCEDHPDSDHLHITTVDVGAEAPLNIVCGAANCRQGLKVMCATVGAVLYPIDATEGFKIKRSKIRGVESLGMLCAEDELGIGSDHAGIIELPEDAVVGTPAREYYHIEDDYLIAIGLTPNRVDAASHIGVARDLVAYLKSQGKKAELKMPSVENFAVDNNNLKIDVEVANADACPRYAGITVTGCKVAPSPEWMQNYLRAAGINPKNNLVDITNFVLFELGQPLHAFDADKIEGGKIVVRNCEEGTAFVTLDGIERKLSAADLMICSAERPMCLAGVFGGLDSGVSETTTNVFIESAYFNPVSVRKSAKRHGLNNDSSFRFDFSLSRAKMLIGTDIADETIKSIITALDVVIEKEENGVLSVAVPPYRVDVQREADLVEDVLRIYGYNNIEIPTHVNSTLSYVQKPDKTRLINMVSDMLTARGYTEIMSNSLTKAAYYENLECYKAENCVKILNPLSTDLNVMRQTLVFNALEAIALNINHKNADLKLYEAGNCYYYNAEAATEENPLAAYSENYRLAIAITGNDSAPSWNCKGASSSFFTLRATVELLLKRFGLDIYDLKCESCDFDIFGDAICLTINKKPLVWMGQISSKLCKTMGIKQEVFFAEIDFDTLIKATRKHKITVTELPKYPEVKRDLALLVDKSVTFATLRAIAFATERKLLKSVALFDVYEGDKLPEGKKSYALSFILEDKSQTLTDKAIERTMAALQAAFEKQTGATVR